jgi:hypothetical protein
MHEALGVDAAGRADRHQPRSRGTGGAERLLVDRRAEAVEERVARVDALHQTHIAEVAVGHDGLATMFGDDVAPAPADLGDRLVPADALEQLGAFRAAPPQRIHQPVGVRVVVVEVLELHAKPAPRHRVVLVATDLDQLAVSDLVDHGAGIRAVMRTCAEKRGSPQLLVPPDSSFRLLGAGICDRSSPLSLGTRNADVDQNSKSAD